MLPIHGKLMDGVEKGPGLNAGLGQLRHQSISPGAPLLPIFYVSSIWFAGRPWYAACFVDQHGVKPVYRLTARSARRQSQGGDIFEAFVVPSPDAPAVGNQLIGPLH